MRAIARRTLLQFVESRVRNRDHRALKSAVDAWFAETGKAFWGAASGTPEGDWLDVIATIVDAYESQRYPMDPPHPIEAIGFRME